MPNDREYVNLYINGDVPVNIGGWTLGGQDQFGALSGLQLEFKLRSIDVNSAITPIASRSKSSLFSETLQHLMGK